MTKPSITVAIKKEKRRRTHPLADDDVNLTTRHGDLNVLNLE